MKTLDVNDFAVTDLKYVDGTFGYDYWEPGSTFLCVKHIPSGEEITLEHMGSQNWAIGRGENYQDEIIEDLCGRFDCRYEDFQALAAHAASQYQGAMEFASTLMVFDNQRQELLKAESDRRDDHHLLHLPYKAVDYSEWKEKREKEIESQFPTRMLDRKAGRAASSDLEEKTRSVERPPSAMWLALQKSGVVGQPERRKPSQAIEQQARSQSRGFEL